MKVFAGLAAVGAVTLAIPVVAVPMLLGVTVATVTCADPAPVTASLDGPSTPADVLTQTPVSDPEGVSGCASIFAATGSDPRLPAAPQQISAAVARELSYVGLRTGFAGKCDRLACRAFNYLNSGYPLSAYDLICRSVYDLTCRSRRGDHGMGSPPATRLMRSLSR